MNAPIPPDVTQTAEQALCQNSPWSEFADRYRLTPVEAKLMRFLSDGEPHPPDECLAGAFGKRFASYGLVPVAIRKLRAKLEPFGFHLDPIRRGSPGYTLVAPSLSIIERTA